MNLENFADYLEHPARLYQLNYQELKNLVMAYPYNANLRTLLLLKGRIEKDDKADTYLNRAAAYTFDRAHLFDRFREILYAQEQLHEPEEMLELRELADLFHEMEILPAWAQSADPPQALAFPLAQEEIIGFRPEGLSEPIIERTDTESEELLFQFPAPDRPADAPVSVAVEPSLPASELPLPPTKQEGVDAGTTLDELAKQRLHQMLEKRKGKLLSQLAKPTEAIPPATVLPPATTVLRPEKPSPDSPKKIKAKVVEQIARKSVTENEELVSETLARLLVQQGQYQRALRMYEKLSLVFPEKISTFGPIIENLQQKI